MTKSKKSQKFAGALATVTVFGVITRILSFIFKVYLSRTLGAEAIGLYQIALSVFYMFAAFSASGIPMVLSRKTAEQAATSNDKQNFSLVSSALFLGLLIALSLVGVILIFKNFLGFMFSDKLALPLFLIMLPALLSTTIYSVIRSWFWGKKEFTAFSSTETIEEICRILFSVLFISGLFASLTGAYAIALAFTISDAVVAIILAVVFFSKGGRITKPKDVKTIFFPAIPITAMRLFAGIISALVAILLPARLIAIGMPPSEATASFGRIAGMANPLLLAPNAIIGSLAVVLVPEMSANGIRGEHEKLNRQLTTGINFSFLACGMFMLLYLALGEKITLFLYKDAISGKYLQFASLIMLPMCLSALTQTALNSIGKEKRAFVNFIIGNVLMVSAVLILPRFIGLYAVAVASMLSLVTTSVCNIYALRKYTDFSLGFLKYMLMVFLICIPSAYFAQSLHSLFFKFLGKFALIPTVVLSVLAYAGLCFGTEMIDIKGFVKLRRVNAK